MTEMVRRHPGRSGGILQPSVAIRGEQTPFVFQERLDEYDETVEVHLNDSGPHLQRYSAQALADQYLPSRRRR